MVLLPSTCVGRVSATWRTAAARPNSASRLISIPGAMAPPRYSPEPDTTSQVVAVPKSTMMVGPPNRS